MKFLRDSRRPGNQLLPCVPVSSTPQVGQKFVVVKDPDGTARPVDKDCIVFKDTFGLKQTWEHMSPVLLPAVSPRHAWHLDAVGV